MKTVLIVDDEESFLLSLDAGLRQYAQSFGIVTAGDGKEALDVLRRTRVDLVVTDLNMPVMDGMTLIRQLRAKPEFKFTPILMLTTESQQEKKAEGKAAGATGWIVKPFDPGRLLEVVKKVIG